MTNLRLIQLTNVTQRGTLQIQGDKTAKSIIKDIAKKRLATYFFRYLSLIINH
jgi:hypothetical protein